MPNCFDVTDICIEKEAGTGLAFYVLRVKGIAYYSSKNMALFPRSRSEPIQTDDLINKKTFTTTKNPTYEDITIVPGLKLEYPVYDGESADPVAEMRVVFKSKPFCSTYCEYCVFDEENANPKLYLDTTTKSPIEQAVLEGLPINDIMVSIYPDESFIFDPRSVVEERYRISMHEKHFEWMHHVFHAFILHFYT